MRERKKGGGGESRPCIHTRTHTCMQWRIESWWCQEPCPWFGCTPWVGSMPPKFVFNFNCHLTSRSWHIVIAGSIRGQARLKKKKQIVFTDLLQRVWQLYTHSVYNGNLLNVTRILRTANSGLSWLLRPYEDTHLVQPLLPAHASNPHCSSFPHLIERSFSCHLYSVRSLFTQIIIYLRILCSTSSSMVW